MVLEDGFTIIFFVVSPLLHSHEEPLLAVSDVVWILQTGERTTVILVLVIGCKSKITLSVAEQPLKVPVTV